MGTFSSLRIGRRPVRCCVLILYRIDPDAVGRVLPEGMRPRLVRDTAVGALIYTRLGSLRSRFLPHRGADSDHLSYRFAVEIAGGNGPCHATWVARRATSSRLSARWSEKILRRDHHRARFDLEEEGLGLTLSVENESGEELYLRAQASDAAPEALFGTPRSIEAFLDETGEVHPPDPLAPEADRVDVRRSLAPESLALLEIRSAFFGDHGPLPRDAVAFDSAWRLVAKRHALVRAPSSSRLEDMLEHGESSPAMQ